MAEKIGFIGLGVMGAPMARHVSSKYDVIVFDIDNAKMQAMANLKTALSRTLSLTAMIMWIVVGATAFTCIFTRAGGMELIRGTLLGFEVHPIIIVLLMQSTLFVLGMFMDPSGIILLCTPIFVPVIKELGFSAVWFGVLFIVNMEMAFLSPPYGINLFYIRGIAPKDITMTDIYLSALPFIAIQAIGLVLIIAFPILAVWIPNLIFGGEVHLSFLSPLIFN